MRRSAPGGGPVLQELAPAGHLNATSILIDGLPADPEALAGGSDKGDKKGRRPPGRSPPGRLGRRLRIAAGAAALTMMALVLLAGQRAPVPSPLMAGGGLPAEALHQAAATAASLGRAGAQAGLWGPQPVQQGEPAGLFQRPQGAASQQAAAVPLLPQQQLQEQGLPQHATAEGAAQWKPQQQAAQLPWHSAERAAGAKAAPGPVLVEFTVPGLHIPLR